MKTTRSSLLIFHLLFTFTAANAQQAELLPHKNAIEVNILFPIFPGNVINAKYTHTLWKNAAYKGDLLIGVNIDIPSDRDTEGNFSDYSLATGYRQFFWKGLFVEYYQLTGYGRLRNHVSKAKTYNSFDWLVAGTCGYKFEFGKRKRIYSILQIGIAKVIYKSNPWPIFEDATLTKEIGEQAFFYGGVQLGFNF